MNAVFSRVEACAKRLDVFAFNNRQIAGAGPNERVPVVGRVQLAAESRGPAGVAAKWREERGGSLGDGSIHGRTEIGNDQVVTREPTKKRRRHPDRKPRPRSWHTVVGLERAGIVFAETAGN